MKVILDIQDKKAMALLEVLKGLSYVKTTVISPEKAKVIKEIKNTVDYLNQVKQGKAIANPVDQLINDL